MMEYIGGLMAPWRRIKRPEFTVALTVLSLPGLLLMLTGMMGQAGGLMSGFDTIRGLAQSGSVEGSLAAVRDIGTLATSNPSAAAGSPTPTLPLMNIPGLINGLCLLALYPFVRGRLLDMGYTLQHATIAAVVIQVSVLNDTLAAVVGASRGPLPMGWAFGLITFVAYILLTFMASRAKKVHERGPSRHSQLDDDFPPP